MANERANDVVTSSVLAWTSHGARLQHLPDDEIAADLDEPPDFEYDLNSAPGQFKRAVVPKIVDHTESLLTKALHESSEDNVNVPHRLVPTRRRSFNSNVSLASTADLTSDTGLTSPARTNTPSPPAISLVELNRGLFDAGRGIVNTGGAGKQLTSIQSSLTPTQACGEKRDTAVELLQKKRCISFACGPKPEAKRPESRLQFAGSPSTTEEKPPRKTCIKFACPAKPVSLVELPQHKQQDTDLSLVETPKKYRTASPVSRKPRSPSASRGRRQRSLTPHPVNQSPVTIRPSKYLTANANDLNAESSRFHEFASDEPVQEDWIRQHLPSSYARLTINDTLRKENEIRRLGKEAEEEALEEEEYEEEANVENEEDVDLTNDFDDDDDDEDEDAEDEAFDSQSDYGSDDVASDGYNTDNEIGFADSEDEDDGELQLWTPSPGLALRLSNEIPTNRRPSSVSGKSDSSFSDGAKASRKIRERSRRIKFRPGTPELPDSTDFVCGTLDEDRVLENAYISCMAVRRREKLHLIPQDIDPSFPTSEPEDDEIEPRRRGHDSDEQLWLHGELEDIHHTKEQDDTLLVDYSHHPHLAVP
ncbi:hypothetical protein ONZ43_g4495 [Nemania bipapillata]|uniref:Uncharacterized protein n=1 Tax=Nemania bipapillata TaxID=110536 RepID=A0ACC2IM56_9PEZI|nr:hypothetical protein ONZ43_g4495 [Nemania bipapillata]